MYLKITLTEFNSFERGASKQGDGVIYITNKCTVLSLPGYLLVYLSGQYLR